MSRMIYLLIVVICLLGCVTLTVSADTLPPQRTGRDRATNFRPGGDGLLPVAPRATAGALSLQPNNPFPIDKSVFNWSRLAFESYRDGNWEIYSMRPDGADAQRLTKDRGEDTRPRQSHSDGRLAFISNRTGNFEIFTVAPDGGDLRQLTADPANDNYPDWSPDGKRIVFASDRSGSWDIYTVNADGSSLTQLTVGENIDFAPAWSADGRFIAFARVSNGDLARIWVANADGANAHPISIEVRYPDNLVWSPDDKWIGFSHDANRNGDMDVAEVRADGSDPTWNRIYTSRSVMSDALMGGYSPDGTLVSFAIINYVVIDDELYIDSSHTAYVRHDGTYYDPPEYFPGSGIDLVPDWERSDFTPPSSRMDTPPRLAGHWRGVFLSWRASDTGGSGIVGYELQYRRAGDAWTNAQSDLLTETSHHIGLSPGEVAFRVRALDAAGNVETWPTSASGEGVTAIYEERAYGTLFDNRHTPIPGVRIIGPYWPDIPFVTGADGEYDVYAYDYLPDLSFPDPAYGNLPGLRARFNEGRYEIALPPTDDSVRNGTFELGLDGWTTALIAPTDLTHPHTGSSGLALVVTENAKVASVRQTVLIPPVQDNPTLSLFIGALYGSPMPGALTARIKSGNGSVAPLALNLAEAQLGWSHAWADLSKWGGSAVELILEVKLGDDDTQDIVFLDDVSVGKWHTPIITAVVSDLTASPATLEVRGGNFEVGAVVRVGETMLETIFVNSGLLSAVAPTGLLPIGRHPVWVQNPSGEEAESFAVFGRSVFLPAIRFRE